MIQVKNLSLKYGDQVVLDNISFAIKRGQITGLLGPNGAGKSTIIKILAGLVFPKSGTLVMNDSLTSFNDLKNSCGFLIDGPAYYPYLSAQQNLDLIKKISNPEINTIKLLEQVGIGHVGKKKVKNFSAGMKQRLAIAMAIMNAPKMLILDEPFNGLDPNGFQELIDLLKSLNESGITILVSSHLLNELEQFADHFILIHQGDISLNLSAHELQELKKNVFFTFNNKPNDQAIQFLQNMGGAFISEFKAAVHLKSSDIANVVNHLVQINCTPVNIETRTVLQEKYFEITS